MAIPEGVPGTGSEPEPTPKKSREKCLRRVPGPPALSHVSGSKTLVTLWSEKNVNLAHTYTLVGGPGIAIPRARLTRFPGQDPGGSGAWNRPQKLRSGPGFRRGSGTGSWVRFVGPGPTPRDGDPRTRVQDPGPRIGRSLSRSLSIDAIDRRRDQASKMSDRRRTIASSHELTRVRGVTRSERWGNRECSWPGSMS
jgi:hypothetical protein